MLKLITLLLTSTMTVMAGATIAPALPQIEEFFQGEPNRTFLVKLMLTIPALFTALVAPFVGIIIDRYGRKPLLIAATILYGLAGGSGLILNSLIGLLIGRALLGVAVAGIMTTATALIADYYQGPKRNQIMGSQAAFMGFGGVAFLSVGGVLADLGWRFPFLIYLTAFLATFLILFCLDEPKKNAQLSAEELKELELDSNRTIPWLTLGAIYMLTFVTMVAFYLVPVQLPFYLKDLTQGQVSNSQTGIAIASLTLASAIISARYKSIKNYLNFQGILVCLYSLLGIGYIIISLAPTYGIVFMGLILAGMGLGLLLPNMNVWLNAIAPPLIRGRALGGLTTCMFLGQFFSPIFSQPITQQVGLGATYGWVGLGMIVLALLILGWSRLKKQVQNC